MHPFWWLAPPPSPRRGDFILRYALSEGIALRNFILPLLAGEVRRSQIGGGERSEPISRMLIKPYDTESKSRNVLASPLGEEGHEVAKGWTVVRMIMIFLFYVLSPPLMCSLCITSIRGAADWRSGPRWSILSVLCLVHPFPLRGTSPQGETRK